MDFLKSLFGSEALTFDQFLEKVNASGIKLANLADGKYVDKHRLEEVEKQLEATNKKYADYDDLKSQRDKAVADGEQKLNDYILNTEIEKALLSAKSLDNVSVNANLDLSKIQLKDGKLTGLDEQLTQLKTDKPFLFKSDNPAAQNTAVLNLGGPTSGEGSNQINKDLSEMSYEEYKEYRKNN